MAFMSFELLFMIHVTSTWISKLQSTELIFFGALNIEEVVLLPSHSLPALTHMQSAA